MRTGRMLPMRTPAVALCALAGLLLSLAAARPAAAWDDGWDSGWDSGYDDYNWSQERMQDAAISSAEEMAREAGRAVRRDEIAKEQEAKSAETQAYYDEVRAASKASLNAPKDAYYRKPGWTSSDAPPPSSPVVTAGQVSLFYDNGIYWLDRAGTYVVVIPPAGIVVDKLPPGVRAQRTKDGMLYYFFGVFYRGKDGKFQTVKPPAGVYVGYLPDGYTQEAAGDATTFKYGDASYKQVFLQGVLVYQVI